MQKKFAQGIVGRHEQCYLGLILSQVSRPPGSYQATKQKVIILNRFTLALINQNFRINLIKILIYQRVEIKNMLVIC